MPLAEKGDAQVVKWFRLEAEQGIGRVGEYDSVTDEADQALSQGQAAARASRASWIKRLCAWAGRASI